MADMKQRLSEAFGTGRHAADNDPDAPLAPADDAAGRGDVVAGDVVPGSVEDDSAYRDDSAAADAGVTQDGTVRPTFTPADGTGASAAVPPQAVQPGYVPAERPTVAEQGGSYDDAAGDSTADDDTAYDSTTGRESTGRDAGYADPAYDSAPGGGTAYDSAAAGSAADDSAAYDNTAYDNTRAAGDTANDGTTYESTAADDAVYEDTAYDSAGTGTYSDPAGAPVAASAYQDVDEATPVAQDDVAGTPAYDTSPGGVATAGTGAAAGTAAQSGVAVGDMDQALFTDNPELRGQWQQIMAEFVDDPKNAVSEAAELVQQASQALVNTLQQRQETMRSQWNSGDEAEADAPTAAGGVDTEQMRQLMKRYRALFDQLCQPV